MLAQVATVSAAVSGGTAVSSAPQSFR